MTDSTSLTPLRQEDYEAIEAAVMETARGRWFLAEYAKRHRSADTGMLLDAIQKLEKNLKRDQVAPNIDRIKLDIADMASAIERTKEEIAQIAAQSEEGGHIDQASNELDAIVEHTETATQEILSTAETVQELAFEMREAGVDGALCDRLEELTTNIYMSCSFQDLTGQRTQKVVHVLRYLESRVHSMIKIWHMPDNDLGDAADAKVRDDTRPDAHLLNGPQLDGQGVDQTDIDSLMSGDDSGLDFEAEIQSFDSDETPAEPDLDAFEAEALGSDGFDGADEDQPAPDADGDLADQSVEDLEALTAETLDGADAMVGEETDMAADDPMEEPADLASFEAEALTDDEESASDDVDLSELMIVEDDLDFADAAPDDDAAVADTIIEEEPETDSADQKDADEAADVFEAASEALAEEDAGEDVAEGLSAADIFEGADVFEIAEFEAEQEAESEDDAEVAPDTDDAPEEEGEELAAKENVVIADEDGAMEDALWEEIELEAEKDASDPTADLPSGARMALFH
ncbi:MAG: protein phosphatase CheZ [Pseudomonadota bacterium]